jgi:hypothetical protein
MSSAQASTNGFNFRLSLASGVSTLRVTPHGFFDRVPMLPGFARQVRIGLAIEIGQLALQFVVALETAFIEIGGAHGAARFVLMGAVSKAALSGEGGDFRESLVNLFGIGPKLKLAEAGQIHE